MAIFVSIQGSVQGLIPGPSSVHKNYWEITTFTGELAVPIDVSTGVPTSQRHWQPIVAAFSFGSHLPKLYNALRTAEVLKLVTFLFYDGANVLQQRVILHDARVASMTQIASSGLPLTEISFTFSTIEIVCADSYSDFYNPGT